MAAMCLSTALLAAALPRQAAAARGGCFGAAARDPVHPCHSTSRRAYPPRDSVEWRPGSPGCTTVDDHPDPICSFGVPAARASAQVALVGDSHALHWRAALDVVAKANRWHAYSLTGNGCLLSTTVFALRDGPWEGCPPWYRGVRLWLKRHPQVSIVIVTQKADKPLTVPPGQTYRGFAIAGFREAWTTLPKTVKHVVVIRDSPTTSSASQDCVQRVLTEGTRLPGPACALPRPAAALDDPAVAAVKQLHAKRYGYVDLTDFFCSPRRCFPVVGGVMVYSDIVGHVTRAYSRSLGPYLLRRFRGLVASW